MVLQRNKSVRVWGTANPEEKLTVKLGEQIAAATADTKGRWSTMIKTGPAGGPFEIEVSVEGSETKVVVRNVMIGEVWICAGQSNMEWPVSETVGAESEIELAKDFPNLRLFTVEHQSVASPQADFARVKSWSLCTPDSVKDFSAVAYFFGRELSQKLKIPIGLINTSWGGTRCEAWMSYESLEADGSFQALLNYWAERNDPTNQNRVATIYNGMVAPLVGYPFQGVIWYQGEANVGRGNQYRRLLPALIKDWRKNLNQGDFPFYFVQLAPYRYENQSPEALPEIWDAQLATFKSVTNTGMVVTTDIGNVRNIHPRNKKEVGRRLSLWFLANIDDPGSDRTRPATDTPTSTRQNASQGKPNETRTETRVNSSVADSRRTDSGSQNGQLPSHIAETTGSIRPQSDARQKPSSSDPAIVCSGPIYESIAISGGDARLTFKYAKGLQTRNQEPPTCFLVCGEDRKFVPAVARIEDEFIVVNSPDISKPIAVRFAWDDSAQPNLFNSQGLPASPFRTDEFDLPSKGIEY